MPSVVQQGLNEWTVLVLDAGGNPVDGTLTITSLMPDHNHGSPTQATITPKGGGSYDVAGINLSMRGVWQVSLTITSPAIARHRDVHVLRRRLDVITGRSRSRSSCPT